MCWFSPCFLVDCASQMSLVSFALFAVTTLTQRQTLHRQQRCLRQGQKTECSSTCLCKSKGVAVFLILTLKQSISFPRANCHNKVPSVNSGETIRANLWGDIAGTFRARWNSSKVQPAVLLITTVNPKTIGGLNGYPSSASPYCYSYT